MRTRVLTALATLLALAACASPEPTYGPSNRSVDGYGYSETRLGPDSFEIRYKDAPESDRAAIDKLLLLRAAELTFANGYDWFRVENRQGRQGGATGLDLGGIGVGVGVSGGSSGGLGGGLSIGVPIAKDPTTAKAQIVMGRGESPGGVDVYDARSLLAERVPAQ